MPVLDREMEARRPTPSKALVLLALSAILSTAAAQPAATRRLAIVPRNAILQEPADLLTVTFSRQSGIELLERSEVQRIVQEQAVAAAAARTDVQLGQQLGAEGLLSLALSTETGRTQLVARLVAVRPGIVLSSARYPWPLEKLDDWAPAVQAQVAPLFPKLGVPARDAIPVSVVNLRSAVQSRAGQQLEKDLTLLLIHRLARQPELFVLERQRLDELSAEKDLKGIAATPFWNGRYLIEGAVDRDGFSPDRVTVHLRLTGPNGATPLELNAAGPRTEPTSVIDILAKDLLARLGKSESALAAWDPKAEAARFLEEGTWALRWKAHEQARWAAESAWALGDRSVAAARLRVLALCTPWNPGPGTLRIDESVLQFTYDRVYPNAIEPLTLALDYFVAATPWLDAGAVANPTNRWLETGLTALSYAAHHLSRYVWSDPTTADVAEPIARLQAAARQAQRVVLRGDEHPTPATYATPHGRQLWETKCVLGWLWEDGPDAVLAEYTRLLDGDMTDVQRRAFLYRDGRRPPLPAWLPADRAKAAQHWEAYLQQRIDLPDLQRSFFARLLRHQFTPTSELVDEPVGSYTRAVRPLLRHLGELGPKFACDQPELFEDALKVINRRQNYLWEPPAGMAVTNAVREFRTNFVHQWAATGPCLQANTLAVLFRASDYESGHLRAVLELVRERTGTGPNQIPRFKQALFRAYLGSGYERVTDTTSRMLKGLYRPEVFELLFDPGDYETADAEQLLEDLQRFRNLQEIRGDPLARPIAAMKARIAESARTAAPSKRPQSNPPSIPQAAPSQSTLQVTRWMQLPNPIGNTRLPTDLRVIDVRHREGRLWIEARLGLHTNSNLNLRRVSRSVLYRVDLSTLAARHSSFNPAVPTLGEIRLWGNLHRTFEVVGDQVYVSWHDQVLRSPAELAEWTPVSIPSGGQARLYGIGGRLYLGTPDRLLEYHPATGESRVMASTRRRPAEGRLDEMTQFQNPTFFAGTPDGSVVQVLLGNTLHSWRVTPGTWGEPTVLVERGQLDLTDVTEQTALLRTLSMSWDTRKLFRIVAGTSPEIVLQAERASPGMGPGGFSPGFSRPSNTREGGGKGGATATRWNTPDSWDPFVFPTTSEPGKVWMLYRRVVSGPQQNPALALFQDDRKDPLMVRLEFNRPNPFPTDESSLMGSHPLLVAAPEGLVLTGRLWPGLWFIPRADLDAALATASRNAAP